MAVAKTDIVLAGMGIALLAAIVLMWRGRTDEANNRYDLGIQLGY